MIVYVDVHGKQTHLLVTGKMMGIISITLIFTLPHKDRY